SLPNSLTRCHSVFSCWLPSRSLRTLVVAKDSVVMAMPPCVYLTSGSLPRLPTRITLLIPLANFLLQVFGDCGASTSPALAVALRVDVGVSFVEWVAVLAAGSWRSNRVAPDRVLAICDRL